MPSTANIASSAATPLAIKGQDYLTALSSKLLVQVIANIPCAEFTTLSHVNDQLRNVMKTYLAAICSAAIRD